MEFYQHKASPKIGLTPLIDVVFILLLFFMLASNFNRWQQMPVAAVSTNGVTSSAASTIELQLYPDSRLQIGGGQPFEVDDWSWLATILNGDADTIFRLTPVGATLDTPPDAALNKVLVQTLIDTVDNLQQRGVSNLVFGQ